MRLSIAEMNAKLKSIGLTRRYKPYNDEANIDLEHGKEVILLETRRPVKIDGAGIMSGVEMDVYDDSTIRVWTSQKKKANDAATKNNFRVRLLDGEAELYIPVTRADEFLHGFGAKVKQTRVMTPEQRAAVKERFARIRQARKAALATAS